MKFDHLILDRLLDRYENSAHYRRTAATSRRVLLRLGPESRDLPEYDIENLESRLAAHIAVKQLATAGFVGYEWARYQQDNVLASVWLILDRVDAAYAWLGRMPGAEIAQAVLGQINSLLESLSAAVSDDSLAAMNRAWVQPALLTMQARIGSTLKLTPLLPANFQLAGEILQTLGRITQTGFAETAMRVFSSQCFQDSKYFENYLRSRLIALMRRFHPQLADQESDEQLPDDDVLRLTGIFRNPEIFEFCGPLVMA